MSLLQDQIRRIYERLKELRHLRAAQSQRSSEDVAEALEDITEAVHQIEQRLDGLERDQAQSPPN